LYTIIYTSGTTGDPKGVMHTVNLWKVLKLFTAVSFRGSFKTIFLLTNCPYSRTCIEKYKYCDWGNSSFPESLQSIASDLEKAQPNFFLQREYGPSFKKKYWRRFHKKIEYATKNTCRK
jgi:long-chain acyl-CoA synthetase